MRPATSSAEKVKKLANEKRILSKELLIAKNFVEYYETLFPWLTDYVGENLDELINQLYQEDLDDETDPVIKYVAKGEYEKLSSAERNQKALDRYWISRRGNWIIGRDYERYIGYLYEIDGFDVKYQGIYEGKEDRGIDLICNLNDTVHIIQCKYWSQDKVIRENHVNQLFGTTVKYILDNYPIKNKSDVFKLISEEKVVMRLVTSTNLSEMAKRFADSLGIQYWEQVGLDFSYPCIKCNISQFNGEKIYHLPFDQQYDSTKIKLGTSEKYVRTVLEAERSGFRRAWRWKG